jgi:microtubule-associated protein-like 6
VSHLSFSHDGKYLASLGEDDWHSLCVHDWENAAVVCLRTTVKETSFDLQFAPPAPRPPLASPVPAPMELVQCGVNFLRFWTVEGHNASWQSASLGSEGQWQTFLCLGFVGVEPWQASVDSGDNRAFAANVVAKPKVNGRRTVVGCQDGALYLLAGIHLSKTIPAHTGPVNVVSCSSGAMASGGADGLVKVWRYVDRTGTLEIKTVIDIATQGSVAPVIRSLDFDPGPNKLLVGTLGAELFELSSLDGTNCSVGGGPLLQGHAHPDEDAEVHGFSAHPTSARFVTTGDDATLRIWDADQRSVVAMTALEAPSRCVAYNPKGTLLAVGFGSAFKKKAKQVDGKFVIMSVGDFSVVYEGQTAGNKYLTECKWSPDGSILVFGCADNRIYIYNADDGYALKASAVSHDFPIRSIDFSKNSTFLLSNCSGYGLNFFEADTGSAISDLAKVKDQKWATCSSPMQWSSMGAWPPQNDGTDVTTCDAVGGVLATGDSFGRLRLFRHPCDSALAQGKLYRAHGSSTPNPMSARGNPPRAAPQITPTLAGEGWGGLSKVRWVGKGRYLVSVAAREKVLFQWVHDVDEAGKADDLDCLPMPMSANLKAEVLGPDASEGPVAVAEENLEGLAAAGAQARAAETAADEEAFGGGAAAAAAAAKKKKKSKGGGEDGGGGAGGDQVGGGSSSLTAKPWLSSMVQPSDPSVFGDPSAPPDLKGLSLERVLGVSSTARGSKQANLGYNSLGECVWCAASVVVVYDKKAHQQRLFRGHHGAEATCVSVSPCGRFVASGERGDRPLVRVWDAATCVEIASLGPFHRRGVACLAWSRDAKTVVSVGADLEHSVAVWGSATGLWEDAKKVVEDGSCKGQTARNQASKLAYACGDHQPVYFACFLDPLCWGPGGLYNQPDLAANAVAAANGVKLPPKHPGYLFATGGVDHVKLWSLEGRTLTCERGLWGAGAKVQPMLCGCAAGARLVTGAASGHLYAWRGRLCEKLVKAHDGPVATCWAVTYADGVGGCVVSGGAHDGCVRLFNEKLEPLSTHDVSASAQVPPLLSGIRGVCGGLAEGGGIAQGASPGGTGEFVNRVLLSTASAEVYELSTQSGSFTLLAEGHYSGDPATEGAFGEAWGLSPHPTKSDLCATCGDDGSVRVWSIANQGRLLRKCLLDSTARCVSWSPDGTKLVVGLGGSAVPGAGRRSKDGCFVVLDADTLEVLHEARDAKHWLRDAKFTPGGESFALCSQDGTVYLYDTRALSLRAKCDNLTGPATRCDFSEDGAYIQVDGGRDTNKHGPGLGFEHMYFGAGNGAAFELPSQLKNVKWGTWTCRLGWPVQAVWPKLEEDVSGGEAESVEPTSCDRNGAKDLVASGYQDGRVQVFRYPSLVKGTHSATVVGHAGAVGLVRFSCDGKFLLSLGQKDRCLLVWRVWRKSEKITGFSLVSSSLVRSPDDGLPPLKLPPPPNPTAAQVAYSMVGAMVEVHGLTTLRPELNGCVGVVTHVLSNQSGGDALAKFVVKLTARPGGGRISKKDRGGLVLRPENTRKIVKIKKDTDGGVVLKN